MIQYIDHRTMGQNDIGWLNTFYHFSFANYYNPHNVQFGVLRVLNDDIIAPHEGFDTHPHRDMEIITYVIDGYLTHKDNMGNEKTISRGDVQYMGAGTGVFHSEFNNGDTPLRLLQLWIFPDKSGYTPSYGDFHTDWKNRRNQWLHVVSHKDGSAPVKINQDANIYVLELEDKQSITFPISKGRKAYLVLIEGTSHINQKPIYERDALEIIEETITIDAIQTSHFLLVEMNQ